jgi:hypothetical protein
MVTIDWRGEICRLLDVDKEIPDTELFEAIAAGTEKLAEVERLRARAMAQQGDPRCEILYRVRCNEVRGSDTLFLDKPTIIESGPHDAHLRGNNQIRNFELFLERNKEVIFIVYRDFECCGRVPPPRPTQRGMGIDPMALFKRERISLLAPELRHTLADLAGLTLRGISHPEFDAYDNDGDEPDISHPYIWWYHRRKEIDQAVRDRDAYSDTSHYGAVFYNYIMDRMESEWAEVDALLAEKKMTARYMDYLFVSGVSRRLIATKDWGMLPRTEILLTT